MLFATSYWLFCRHFERRDFAQLEVWRKAKDLVIDVYRETARFPVAEQ
jgi:hypothetical protein